MDEPDFLRFNPVPVRARHNGWAPAVQRRFVLHLARGAGPGEAARHVGRTRQTAYALRARPGAESFAAAWDAAVAFAARARDARRLPGPLLAQCGLETMLVPRFYRGRLVGFVQREDHRRALRTLKQLDRVVDGAKRARVDPAIYDEALRALGGTAGAETDDADRMEVRRT
ncbi:MAG TPA: hypothetical protein VEZ48_02630 [Sphingomonadaceae bacterium]|nr:hypothetical protein [Sphingomonadaceae bacterium]